MEFFVREFRAYRLDEVMGAWKPFRDVVEGALRCTCKKVGVEYRDADTDHSGISLATRLSGSITWAWGRHVGVAP